MLKFDREKFKDLSKYQALKHGIANVVTYAKTIGIDPNFYNRVTLARSVSLWRISKVVKAYGGKPLRFIYDDDYEKNAGRFNSDWDLIPEPSSSYFTFTPIKENSEEAFVSKIHAFSAFLGIYFRKCKVNLVFDFSSDLKFYSAIITVRIAPNVQVNMYFFKSSVYSLRSYFDIVDPQISKDVDFKKFANEELFQSTSNKVIGEYIRIIEKENILYARV